MLWQSADLQAKSSRTTQGVAVLKMKPKFKLERVAAFAESGIQDKKRYKGKTLRVYCNRSGDRWDIPAGNMLLGFNLQLVAPHWLTLGPRGFCIIEDAN